MYFYMYLPEFMAYRAQKSTAEPDRNSVNPLLQALPPTLLESMWHLHKGDLSPTAQTLTP